MGKDYSYTQPSSSDEFDMTSLLEAEAELYKDEVNSTYEAPVYAGEGDAGIPSTCYCGSQPIVATSYTAKDPGRLYYTCENRGDGESHIWKWCDVAVTEEISDHQRQMRLLKDHGFEFGQRLDKLQKLVYELSKKQTRVTNGLALGVCVVVSAFVFIGLAVIYLTGAAAGEPSHGQAVTGKTSSHG
ncbi:hypothetical protein Bca52824_066984 [Brassica carinata]|uniref:Zinc finger GRF-type domain-containing protein n=1 Tax=Brassica carinata TaxID=52824 RepID=A0A8X7UBE8_BRACI|nr:hypothetical protein Bca52824_066984 [Brassica carinata]